jgi:hypothetical protein
MTIASWRSTVTAFGRLLLPLPISCRDSLQARAILRRCADVV